MTYHQNLLEDLRLNMLRIYHFQVHIVMNRNGENNNQNNVIEIKKKKLCVSGISEYYEN